MGASGVNGRFLSTSTSSCGGGGSGAGGGGSSRGILGSRSFRRLPVVRGDRSWSDANKKANAIMFKSVNHITINAKYFTLRCLHPFWSRVSVAFFLVLPITPVLLSSRHVFSFLPHDKGSICGGGGGGVTRLLGTLLHLPCYPLVRQHRVGASVRLSKNGLHPGKK